ncbi:hypothetical protein D3C71_2204390 [compost metagenome]
MYQAPGTSACVTKAAAALASSTRPVSLPFQNPISSTMNTAGKAKSRPMTVMSPITEPKSAPVSVAMFQTR